MRLKAGRSVPEVAEAIGITRQAVYAWENGASFPYAKQDRIIARLYRVPLAAIQQARMEHRIAAARAECPKNHLTRASA